MIICICRRVSDRDIAHAVRAGCASFDELQRELAVSTVCGKCRHCAIETFQQHADARCTKDSPSVALQAGNGRGLSRPALAAGGMLTAAATA